MPNEGLIKRLRYGIRDAVTGEPLEPGAFAHVCVEDIRDAIAAYLAALPAPDLADGVVAELADIANDEDLGPATTDVRSALERAASALRSFSARLAAVERERDATRELLTDLADAFEQFLGDLGHPQDSWQRDQIARARKETTA